MRAALELRYGVARCTILLPGSPVPRCKPSTVRRGRAAPPGAPGVLVSYADLWSYIVISTTAPNNACCNVRVVALWHCYVSICLKLHIAKKHVGRRCPVPYCHLQLQWAWLQGVRLKWRAQARPSTIRCAVTCADGTVTQGFAQFRSQLLFRSSSCWQVPSSPSLRRLESGSRAVRRAGVPRAPPTKNVPSLTHSGR